MLKDELKFVLIITDEDGEKLLVDTNGERREMLSYGLKFIPLSKLFDFFERNFDMNYEKEKGSAFFVKTKCSDIIKEISELIEEVKR
jgi:hypothetical protein